MNEGPVLGSRYVSCRLRAVSDEAIERGNHEIRTAQGTNERDFDGRDEAARTIESQDDQ